MSKRVLIVTYYWPPAGGGGVQRWVKFVKYLRDYGWEPVVFTASGAEYPTIDESMTAEIPAGTEVIKHKITEPYTLYNYFTGKKKSEKVDPNFLSQGKKLSWKDKLAVWVRGNFFIPDARFLWIRPASNALNHYLLSNHVDAIISTGPPHTCHLIALRIAKKHKLPWIADFRDPWTGIDYFDDLRLSNFALTKHKTLEKSVLDQASCIITVGKTMAADLSRTTATRIEVITNGFDESDRLGAVLTDQSNFEISYIGTMNDARNPLGFWQAIADIKKTQPETYKSIKINLVGKPEQVVIDAIDNYGITDCIHFAGYVPHKEAINYLNRAAILLLVINQTTNNKSILTGKIFEYLMVRKPILCIGPEDGDAADIIIKSNAGLIFDYSNSIGMRDYVLAQYEAFQKGIFDTKNGDIEQYSRRSLTKKLSKILDEISV